MNRFKTHWRIILPITLMLAIFITSHPDLPTSGYPKLLTFLYIFLGASWYYNLRTLNAFTPGFTALGSLLLSAVFATLKELLHPFTPGHIDFLVRDILLSTLAALIGIVVFALLFYFTRTPAQKKARRKKIDQIWAQNAKLLKKKTKK